MRVLLILAVMLALWAPAALAGERVVFSDGRTMEVRGWEAAGDQAVLDLDGGGRIIVPLARIASVEEVRFPAPETPPAPRARSEAPWRVLAGEYADLIEQTAVRHRVDPALVAAMAKVESDFDPYAVSHKGACGLLQLLPETAERFGVTDIFDEAQNLDGGARYLRWLLDRFEGDTELALAAYNAGEQAVEQHGGIPPYPETRDYVVRVLQRAR